MVSLRLSAAPPRAAKLNFRLAREMQFGAVGDVIQDCRGDFMSISLPADPEQYQTKLAKRMPEIRAEADVQRRELVFLIDCEDEDRQRTLKQAAKT